jgi:hypothetical protein
MPLRRDLFDAMDARGARNASSEAKAPARLHRWADLSLTHLECANGVKRHELGCREQDLSRLTAYRRASAAPPERKALQEGAKIVRYNDAGVA